VRTQNEQVFAGLILEETPERVVIKTAEGERIVVPAADVAGKRGMSVSIMPEGLAQAVSDTELSDLLAYLAALKRPAIIVPEFRLLGPAPADAPIPAAAPVEARRLAADREGRIDLETALGARAAAAVLYASLHSAKAQTGRIVVLVPTGAKVLGSLGGRPLAFEPVKAGADPKAGTAWAADITFAAGANEPAVKIVGDGKAALFAVVTVVSDEGVESGRK
jgi:hypothetical protein